MSFANLENGSTLGVRMSQKEKNEQEALASL
jgi:hypothetical protein